MVIEIVWGVFWCVLFLCTHTLNGFTGRFEYDSTLATAFNVFLYNKKTFTNSTAVPKSKFHKSFLIISNVFKSIHAATRRFKFADNIASP